MTFKTNPRSSLQLPMLLFFDKMGEHWTIEAANIGGDLQPGQMAPKFGIISHRD